MLIGIVSFTYIYIYICRILLYMSEGCGTFEAGQNNGSSSNECDEREVWLVVRMLSNCTAFNC